MAEKNRPKIMDGVRRTDNSLKPPIINRSAPATLSEENFYREREGDSSPIITEEETTLHNIESSVQSSGRGVLFWGMIAGGVGITILATLLSTVLARVTVVVKPRIDSVSFNGVAVALDASVSRVLFPQKVIPAEIFEFSKKVQADFAASGREFIEDKARGKVKLYNHFSSSPQTLVEGTRFLTESGVLFRLPKTTLIPGAKIEEGKIVPESIAAELVADKAGEESNMSGEVTLKIPGFKGTAKYDSFYAVAQTGFTGGFRGEARVVSGDDIKKAEEQLSKQAFDELRQEISRRIPAGFTLLDSLRTIEILRVTSPQTGLRRENFPVEVEARGRTLVFREQDMQNFLSEAALKDRTDAKVLRDSFRLEYQPRSVEYEKKKANILVQGEVKLQALIGQEELAGLLQGKKEGTIIEILKDRKELASFSVAFFPPWLLRAPSDPRKVHFIGGE